MSGLTDRQVEDYFERGFLVIESLFDPARLDGLIGELNCLVEDWANRYHALGRLDDMYSGEPFERRLYCIGEAMVDTSEAFEAVLGKRKTPATFQVLTLPEILDTVESVIGPEILVHPQFNSRAKLPDSRSVVDWHQDIGFLDEEVEDTFMVNFWVPLVDSDKKNGCLEVIPGSHKVGRIPFSKSPEDLLPEAMPKGEPVSCPVPKGGALLLQHKTVHRSTENCSDGIRWSLDIRYSDSRLPTGRPNVPGFIARSRKNPAAVCPNLESWLQLFEGIEA